MKNKILSLLESDSRLTSSKIAIMLGIEEGDVKAAIRELEEENVILGYNTIINWDLAGRETTRAHIEIKLTPQRGGGFDTVAERIYKYPQVKSVTLMSGAYDLLVQLRVRVSRKLLCSYPKDLLPWNLLYQPQRILNSRHIRKTACFLLKRKKTTERLLAYDGLLKINIPGC